MKHRIGDGLRRCVGTGAAILALLVGATGLAAAAPVVSERPVHMTWEDSDDGSVTTEGFFGVPVVVPGDSAHRSLTVRNGGPSDATLTARIINVELAGTATGASYYDDLQIRWTNGSASMRELHTNGETEILQVPLAQGAQTEVALEYLFPLNATSGNHTSTAADHASFDVELQLGGDLPDATSGIPPASENAAASGLLQGTADLIGNQSQATRPTSAAAEIEVGGPAGTATGSDAISGTTAPFGLNLPDEQGRDVEASDAEQALLDTGTLELVGGVRNWPITITVILAGFAWAVVRTLRPRRRTDDY